MVYYKDNNGKIFGLLYVQNPQSNALPKNEPTWWFQPLRIKKQIGLSIGLENIPGAWPVPLAENLVARVLSEFKGRVRDVASGTSIEDTQVDVPQKRGIKKAAEEESE